MSGQYRRPGIVGLEHIPRTGPAILAGNHLSVADSFFLILLVPRRVTFDAKSEYFTGRGFKGAFKRWFFTAAGQIPIDREGADASASALAAARRILRDGGIWAIYPEGTRSPDGRLHRGKAGVARVALSESVPVIPVVVHGTDAINPIGTRVWRPGRVRITVGLPVDVCGRGVTRDAARALTDEIMREIRRHSGQDYVDEYATPRRRSA